MSDTKQVNCWWED